MVPVFQQDDGFARGLKRELLVIGVIGDFFRIIGIDIGIIEKSYQKLFAENVRHSAIDGGFRDFSIFRLLNQAGEGIWKGSSTSTPDSKASLAAASLVPTM